MDIPLGPEFGHMQRRMVRNAMSEELRERNQIDLENGHASKQGDVEKRLVKRPQSNMLHMRTSLKRGFSSMLRISKVLSSHHSSSGSSSSSSSSSNYESSAKNKNKEIPFAFDRPSGKSKFRLRLLQTIRGSQFHKGDFLNVPVKKRGLDKHTIALLQEGNFDEALETLDASVSRALQSHGETSSQHARILNTYAQVWSDKASALAIGGFELHQSIEEAIACAERAREIYEHVLIIRAALDDQVGQARAHQGLVHLLEDGPQPDYIDALDHAEQCFLITLRLCGPKHADTKAAAQDVCRLRKRNGGLTLVQV
mmetsp:Transcript_7822/g.15519  ORF Transcript_7822/g.15519 Transcript_7822/m.15519 type:complete len:312 (+) Transcript_7822:556-1491(+)|eukprot:CAMPEP_0171485512 /NCGR_PEP_ID=MMETSP0958-20121227/587_1 /TAXON_ID=87120 /ORGANISM="Aurantiochytrium limacinum, Strain ATCCMYA-1381" /LENGTH=311 /DNA_ID=CAMNT_0012018311 /DNA_START=1992 /DNA_END=2927 /DNA_ORIENTATION=-